MWSKCSCFCVWKLYSVIDSLIIIVLSGWWLSYSVIANTRSTEQPQPLCMTLYAIHDLIDVHSFINASRICKWICMVCLHLCKNWHLQQAWIYTVVYKAWSQGSSTFKITKHFRVDHRSRRHGMYVAFTYLVMWPCNLHIKWDPVRSLLFDYNKWLKFCKILLFFLFLPLRNKFFVHLGRPNIEYMVYRYEYMPELSQFWQVYIFFIIPVFQVYMSESHIWYIFGQLWHRATHQGALSLAILKNKKILS